VCQALIPTGERSGLLTRIGTTEGVWLWLSDEKLTAFVELEAAILAFWAFDCLQSNNRVTFFLRLTSRIAATLA
jgi:hypothetical protein